MLEPVDEDLIAVLNGDTERVAVEQLGVICDAACQFSSSSPSSMSRSWVTVIGPLSLPVISTLPLAGSPNWSILELPSAISCHRQDAKGGAGENFLALFGCRELSPEGRNAA
jgi:hypothetical protein